MLQLNQRGAAVAFESSNPNKVSVAKDGTVTANEIVEEDNKVIITAKSGNKTATCEVTTYNIYEIDWATTSFNNPALGFENETVYDKAYQAKKVEFIKDKESTNGVCVGEVKANGQDRVYASFSNELLKIWSPGKIALDDEDKVDKGEGPGTFSDCNEITSIDFSNIDTHLITDMSYMFSGCNELKTINLTLFDTSNVTNIEFMFFCCSSLDNVLDLCSFDTSNVIKMNRMFYEDNKIKTIYVSNSFKVDKVLSPEGDNGNLMFKDCNSLTGGKGSTLTLIRALDDNHYESAIYARIDKGNTKETAGYFSEKPE